MIGAWDTARMESAVEWDEGVEQLSAVLQWTTGIMVVVGIALIILAWRSRGRA